MSNPNAFKYGVTDAILRRPVNNIFTDDASRAKYERGYLHGQKLSNEGELLEQYDDYYAACERANKIPMSFDNWKATLC